MANKTTNDTTLQSTKQMLDELDALMDKMLSLPVNDVDDAPAFPQQVVKPPVLTPTLSATLTLLESPTRTPTPATQAPTPHPAVNPPHMEVVAPARPEPPPPLPEPAPAPEPLTNEVVPPSMRSRIEPLLEEVPEPETAFSTQWGYLPLLWINVGFDGVTTLLGGAGESLRSQGGRMLLGVSGLALMAAAVGWFLKDWLGWN